MFFLSFLVFTPSIGQYADDKRLKDTTFLQLATDNLQPYNQDIFYTDDVSHVSALDAELAKGSHDSQDAVGQQEIHELLSPSQSKSPTPSPTPPSPTFPIPLPPPATHPSIMASLPPSLTLITYFKM